ncbi:26S proteasome complex ubiquitin receptor,subunit Rpn13 [Ostreococcus tauri]|uniref:26S proteasome complex ubiquitin receptor,subunit Rpn13 n=1 Tax=Ostreococcus tauri TaxID=70448 RepID=Q00YP5_OSTTA|nr:26S proteasome complex ubiquitin receptor,subunit Rpn13 [Ostreococcus tauri]CAL55864.1 26S proteasome complex ubiquitin receptor,subunit Rpn13 [Ostreococcus tauri]|eukprot:XP_003082061.1 26S proteasome complex ubiquitin receptor,subunit Rpn13 [Ostreococcus tauri]
MDSVPNFFGGNDGSDGGFTLNRVDGVSTGTNGEVILSEIKCGLLRRDGTTMRADVRKGTLRIIQAALDDTLKQIQWGPREANTGFEAEEDFIILPDEAVLKTMKQPGCFALSFLEERDRDMYFWFQEPKDADKEAMLMKCNRLINTNVMAALGRGEERSNAEATMEDAPDEGTETTPSIPGTTPALVNAAAMAAPSPVEPTPAPNMPPAETPAAPAKDGEGMRTPASAANFTPIVTSDALKGVFANLGGATPRTPPVGLPEILTPELVGPLLRDESIRGRLLEYLPEEHRETEDLEELIRTPQFRSQLEAFSHAIQSGEMDMTQFGLKESGVADLEKFLRAIQAEMDDQEANDAMES